MSFDLYSIGERRNMTGLLLYLLVSLRSRASFTNSDQDFLEENESKCYIELEKTAMYCKQASVLAATKEELIVLWGS